MPKRLIDLRGTPLLDIASYARKGPGRRDRISQSEIELIERTVNRTPEVMVKVLTRGGQDLRAIERHLSYLSRKGELDVETDDGERIAGKEAEKRLLRDWNLDLEEPRRAAELGPRQRTWAPKLVHKVLFSMPPGTPPDKVLAAVKNFAREEFGLKHRYVMVLHTDEPHPHVHMIIKAVSELGVRLNIKKSTLRDWRQKFAQNLRREGIAANATERAVRGESRTQKTDGIYRANLRGESRHISDRVDVAAQIRMLDRLPVEDGRAQLRATRRDIGLGWRAVSAILEFEGHADLAAKVRRFTREMLPPRTELELFVAAMHRVRSESLTRTPSYDRAPSGPAGVSSDGRTR